LGGEARVGCLLSQTMAAVAAVVTPPHWRLSRRLSHLGRCPGCCRTHAAAVAETRPEARRVCQPAAGFCEGSGRIATAAAELAAVAWSGSATAAATVATSAGFRVALGIDDYIHEEKGMPLARIPPAFSSALACPKIMSAWREIRICQMQHRLLSRGPSSLLSQRCGCCRADAVPPSTAGPSIFPCPAALRPQPQHCDSSRDSSQ
jgi:hypothetical protein